MPILRPPRPTLASVLAGGYPPEYGPTVQGATNVTPLVMTTCPSGVWRVVIRASAEWVSGAAQANTIIQVLRGGVYYTVNTPDNPINSALYKTCSQMDTPLTLRPGDSLTCRDILTGANISRGCCAYVDVPIPEGEPTL